MPTEQSPQTVYVETGAVCHRATPGAIVSSGIGSCSSFTSAAEGSDQGYYDVFCNYVLSVTETT